MAHTDPLLRNLGPERAILRSFIIFFSELLDSIQLIESILLKLIEPHNIYFIGNQKKKKKKTGVLLKTIFVPN